LFAFLDLGQVGIRKTGKPGELLSFEPLLGSGNLDRLTQGPVKISIPLRAGERRFARCHCIRFCTGPQYACNHHKYALSVYVMLSVQRAQPPSEEGLKMATGSAVDLVRACLEHEPPHGLRVGPPQISGTLSLFPIFRDAAGLDYVTLAEAKEAQKSVEITELGVLGTVSRLVVQTAGA